MVRSTAWPEKSTRDRTGLVGRSALSAADLPPVLAAGRTGSEGLDGREAPAAASGVCSFSVALERPIELFHDLKAHPAHDFSLRARHLLFPSQAPNLVVKRFETGDDLLELLVVGVSAGVSVIAAGLLVLQRELAESVEMPQQLARPAKVAVQPLLEIDGQRIDHLEGVGIRLRIRGHALRERLEELPSVDRRREGVLELGGRRHRRCPARLPVGLHHRLRLRHHIAGKLGVLLDGRGGVFRAGAGSALVVVVDIDVLEVQDLVFVRLADPQRVVGVSRAGIGKAD
mmetsp:Transcript_25371/g.59422  ORF Transcript_25371/g.59422 Transcript_25371/m.59422 type:complete len:286 (+) Transcript_25371:160-1017(+)